MRSVLAKFTRYVVVSPREEDRKHTNVLSHFELTVETLPAWQAHELYSLSNVSKGISHQKHTKRTLSLCW
jgi:hypothetical protein